ncbi:MAG: hypothetical protein NT022_02925, partial [Deltaproteobacteria bacterium]|nr:hypothetical protein [Deltaproteobacteria bacterium]
IDFHTGLQNLHSPPASINDSIHREADVISENIRRDDSSSHHLLLHAAGIWHYRGRIMAFFSPVPENTSMK